MKCPDCPPVRAARDWAVDALPANLMYVIAPFAITLLVIAIVSLARRRQP